MGDSTILSVFFQPSDNTPSFAGPASEIYEYVERCAAEIGTEIKRNRGLPPNSSVNNMLTVTEKAIVILGFAMGMTAGDVIDRVNVERIKLGQDLCDRNAAELTSLKRNHQAIIDRVRQDVFEGMERASPLTKPQYRAMFHATILEYYRQAIIRVVASSSDVETGGYDKNGNPVTIEQEIAVMRLDRAMEPHLKYFDNLSLKPDLLNSMNAPSDQVRKEREAAERAEAELDRRVAAGEITEDERIEKLRVIRNGPEDDGLSF